MRVIVFTYSGLKIDSFMPLNLKIYLHKYLFIKKILITGGAGFIGSHITGHLLQNGHEVICLDSFDEYYDPVIKRQNIESFLSFDNFTLIEGDITDQLLLQDAMEGCDYVFHQAARQESGYQLKPDVTSYHKYFRNTSSS